MAKLGESVLGQVSGKLDNLVLRKFNGKTFISVRPENYNTGKSISAKENREKFAAAVEFARIINSNELLKLSWKSAFPNNFSAYNSILINNLRHIKKDCPGINNIITPEGFNPEFRNLSIQNNEIVISLKSESKLTNTELIVLLAAFNPNEDKEKKIFYKLISSSQIFTSSFKEYNYAFSNDEIHILKKYQSYNLSAALLVINDNNLEWSSTGAVSAKIT